MYQQYMIYWRTLLRYVTYHQMYQLFAVGAACSLRCGIKRQNILFSSIQI